MKRLPEFFQNRETTLIQIRFLEGFVNRFEAWISDSGLSVEFMREQQRLFREQWEAYLSVVSPLYREIGHTRKRGGDIEELQKKRGAAELQNPAYFPQQGPMESWNKFVILASVRDYFLEGVTLLEYRAGRDEEDRSWNQPYDNIWYSCFLIDPAKSGTRRVWLESYFRDIQTELGTKATPAAKAEGMGGHERPLVDWRKSEDKIKICDYVYQKTTEGLAVTKAIDQAICEDFTGLSLAESEAIRGEYKRRHPAKRNNH